MFYYYYYYVAFEELPTFSNDKLIINDLPGMKTRVFNRFQFVSMKEHRQLSGYILAYPS